MECAFQAREGESRPTFLLREDFIRIPTNHVKWQVIERLLNAYMAQVIEYKNSIFFLLYKNFFKNIAMKYMSQKF